MMYPTYRDLQVHHEQRKDEQRAIEQRAMLRAAGLQQAGRRLWRRRAFNWLGTRLIVLGTRLQETGSAPAVPIASRQ